MLHDSGYDCISFFLQERSHLKIYPLNISTFDEIEKFEVSNPFFPFLHN